MRKINFHKALNHELPEETPLYCTGYPEKEFLANYVRQYKLQMNPRSDIILNNKNFSLIARMGFDAISLWDYRRGKGGYELDNGLRVDGWGRVYKGKWYQNDGVFKQKAALDTWDELHLPKEKKFEELKEFLPQIREMLVPILSLPGLFEKTWQSMGLFHFSKYLHNDINYVHQVIAFYANYIKDLLDKLFAAGARSFLIADDCGYKQRTFLSKERYEKLFAKPYKTIIKIIKDHNGKVILHADGNISDFVDLFIEWGFDALQSLEPNAGVDIFSLFEQYTNKICFIGNLDVSTLLSYGKPQQVKEYVKKVIYTSRIYQSPLIVSPTQQIHTQIDPENIKSMIETTKKSKD
ncbi:MAG: uroporphyrinogen decarboxylase family protein [Promethearchaeia archaeon]